MNNIHDENKPVIWGDGGMIYHGLPKLTIAWFALVSLCLFGFICYQSLRAAEQVISVHGFDKIAHGFAYLVLGVFTYPALRRYRPIFVFFGLFMAGFVIEILQHGLGGGRMFDIKDAMANGAGAGLAYLVWICVSAVYNMIVSSMQ